MPTLHYIPAGRGLSKNQKKASEGANRVYVLFVKEKLRRGGGPLHPAGWQAGAFCRYGV